MKYHLSINNIFKYLFKLFEQEKNPIRYGILQQPK